MFISFDYCHHGFLLTFIIKRNYYLFHYLNIDQRPCPKGWVEVDRPNDANIYKPLKNISMQECADTCYWDPQCTSFEAEECPNQVVSEYEDKTCKLLCEMRNSWNETDEENCQKECTKKFPCASCKLMNVLDQSSAKSKRILSARNLIEEIDPKKVYCAPAGKEVNFIFLLFKSLYIIFNSNSKRDCDHLKS